MNNELRKSHFSKKLYKMTLRNDTKRYKDTQEEQRVLRDQITMLLYHTLSTDRTEEN